MRATYVWISRLIAIGVVLQAMFIAFGTFGILKDADDGRAYTGDFNAGQVLHSIFGLGVIPLLTIILLIVSFFARVPGGVKWAAILFGLVVLQFLLALVSFGVPFIGLLHGLNAFAIAGVAGIAGRGTRAARTPVGPEVANPV
jgi:heme A synthase